MVANHVKGWKRWSDDGQDWQLRLDCLRVHAKQLPTIVMVVCKLPSFTIALTIAVQLPYRLFMSEEEVCWSSLETEIIIIFTVRGATWPLLRRNFFVFLLMADWVAVVAPSSSIGRL